MPIYEYQCEACGHHEEVIQKISDKPLRRCANCGKNKLKKQVSSTAFQLKGEGWYVTDFKDKKPVAKPDSSTNEKTETSKEAKPKDSSEKKTD